MSYGALECKRWNNCPMRHNEKIFDYKKCNTQCPEYKNETNLAQSQHFKGPQKPKIKKGLILKFKNGDKARLERIGDKILTFKMIGHRQVSKSAIGEEVIILGRQFLIRTTGKEFQLISQGR